MSALTLAEAEVRFNVTHLDYLDREASVPVVSKLSAQGDVLIRRNDERAAVTPIPADGFPAVRGESSAGNTHLLVGEGFYDSRVATPNDLVIGVLTVPEGSEVLLSHPEHGGLLIAPGSYELRRQREEAEQRRMVAD